MSNHYNLDELEEFLSDAAERHRMFPSDRVWRNIDREINNPNQNRWPALTFGALLTGAIITAGLILIHPDKSLFSVQPYESDQTTTPAGKQISQAVETQAKAKVISMANYQASKKDLAKTGFYAQSNPLKEPASTENLLEAPSDLISGSASISETQATARNSAIGYIPLDDHLLPPVLFSIGNAAGPKIAKVSPSITANEPETDIVSMPVHDLQELALQNEAPEMNSALQNTDELLRHHATPAIVEPGLLPNTKKSNRLRLQVYATPSISYRFLSETKPQHLMNNSAPMALVQNSQVDANQFARHSPALGLEAGAALQYQLTPQLTIKAGLQGNLRQYKIEAFESTAELSTIMLDMGGYSAPITEVSSISNRTGYRSIEMNNRYWQVGIPIGLEFKVAEKNRLQLVIGGGIQPSYLFSSKVHMLSSDYKNYMQQPDLLRRWTLNTALEAFVNYRSGNLTWQLGPQIRYQLTPTTIQQYPIKDQLIDYGIKIGVVKTLD